MKSSIALCVMPGQVPAAILPHTPSRSNFVMDTMSTNFNSHHGATWHIVQNFHSEHQDKMRPASLWWFKVNNNTSFVLQYNGTETNISAPDGDRPVTHTVSSLTAGTRYTFTLFSVIGNVRDSGEQLTAVT
ncbi:hypothetical protein XENORESO_005871, partial [Xenotaenia resolanae]